MAGHALAGAGKAHVFLGGGLHADGAHVHPQVRRDVFPHLWDVGRQLRPLGDHGHVAVLHGVSRLLRFADRRPEDHPAVDPLCGGVAVGEKLTDIPQSRRPQDGVRQGMEQRAAHAFEAYDYETLNRERNGAPDLVFHSENARGCPVTCFYEIHGQQGELLYRRYEISGSGREREACSSTVYDLFRRFLTEARNPLSRFWIDARVQAWVQFVTGLPWKDLKNLQRPTDTPQIREARSFLCEVINT